VNKPREVPAVVDVSFVAKDGSFSTVERYDLQNVDDLCCWKANERSCHTTHIKTVKTRRVTDWPRELAEKRLREIRIKDLLSKPPFRRISA